MKIKREILKIFLESDDWNNEKTLNLFDKLDINGDDCSQKLVNEIDLYKEKNERLKRILEDTLDCLKQAINLSIRIKNKNSQVKIIENKTIANKNYINTNMNKTEEIKSSSEKSLDYTEFWNQICTIIKSEEEFKEKNKTLITLLCKYKKYIKENTNSEDYKKIINLIESFKSVDNHYDLYYNLILNVFSIIH